MAEIVMPRLSDTMEEGTILRWLKRDGEHVARGEELVEIETDKAAMVYESDEEGVLAIVAARATRWRSARRSPRSASARLHLTFSRPRTSRHHRHLRRRRHLRLQPRRRQHRATSASRRPRLRRRRRQPETPSA